eukprot:scaffold26893_cov80-Attheya_sp.AAC.2
MEESREKESNWRERDGKMEPGARLDRQKKTEEKTRENTKKGDWTLSTGSRGMNTTIIINGKRSSVMGITPHTNATGTLGAVNQRGVQFFE